MTVFGIHQGASTILCKAFDWKHRMFMLEVEAIPLELYSVSANWFEYYYFIYEKFVVCGEF
jgi:hypothetical protein